MFVQYARQISTKAQDDASEDPHAEEILAVCDRIEATALKHLSASHLKEMKAATQAVPVASRVLVLVLACLYVAYAWNIEAVRSTLGLPVESYSGRVDLCNRFLAGILLSYALVVVLTGRRLTS